MKPETILEEKAKKHFCYFDTIQTKAIIEAMEFYRNYYPQRISTFEIYENIQDFTCKLVSEFYGVDMNDQRQKPELSWARYVYFYLIKKYTRMSLEQIGMPFKRSHSMVLIGIQKVKNTMDVYPKINDEINHLDDIVKQKNLTFIGL